MVLRRLKASKSKKGQITVEYLVLSLVVLALLSISIAILLEVNKTSRRALDNVAFRKSALDLYATVEEVCALGAGNSRTITIKTDMAISKNGQNIVFENNGIGAIRLNLVCPYDINSNNLKSGLVSVTAKRDEIEVANA